MNDSGNDTTTNDKVIAPFFEIFQPDIIDNSCEEFEYIEYKDQNISTVVSQNRYDIETRDKDSLIYPHSGFLEVQYSITQSDGTIIPPTDIVSLQNCVLSLFSDAEYLIEDQRIDYVRDPGLVYTIKNITDFSKQYGESIASNEGFYFDTHDKPSIPGHNVRFYVNPNPTAARAGKEIFFVEAANAVFRIDQVASGTEDASRWLRQDPIVAFIGNFPTPGTSIIVNDLKNYNNFVVFTNNTLALANTKAEITLSLSNTPNGDLSPSAGADTDVQEAFLQSTGELIKWYKAIPNGTVKPIKMTLGTAAAAAGILTTLPIGAAGYYLYGGVIDPNFYNQGFTKRYNRLKSTRLDGAAASISKTDTVFIPLKNIFGFARAYTKASRGLRHRMVFNRNNDSEALIKFGNHPDRKFSLTSISAWIPRLKGSLQVVKKLESELSSNDVVDVNFTDLTLYSNPGQLYQNGSNNAIQLATTSKRPIRVWVAFMLQTRAVGGQLTNRRVFDRINVSDIEIRLNGRKYPLYSLKFPDPTTYSGFNRAYMMLMNAAYKLKDHDEGSLLTLENYYTNYPIYYFDLTAQEDQLFSSVKYSELEVRWSNSTINNYCVYIVYESERKIKMQALNGSLSMIL